MFIYSLLVLQIYLSTLILGETDLCGDQDIDTISRLQSNGGNYFIFVRRGNDYWYYPEHSFPTKVKGQLPDEFEGQADAAFVEEARYASTSTKTQDLYVIKSLGSELLVFRYSGVKTTEKDNWVKTKLPDVFMNSKNVKWNKEKIKAVASTTLDLRPELFYIVFQDGRYTVLKRSQDCKTLLADDEHPHLAQALSPKGMVKINSFTQGRVIEVDLIWKADRSIELKASQKVHRQRHFFYQNDRNNFCDSRPTTNSTPSTVFTTSSDKPKVRPSSSSTVVIIIIIASAAIVIIVIFCLIACCLLNRKNVKSTKSESPLNESAIRGKLSTDKATNEESEIEQDRVYKQMSDAIEAKAASRNQMQDDQM